MADLSFNKRHGESRPPPVISPRLCGTADGAADEGGPEDTELPFEAMELLSLLPGTRGSKI